MATTEKKPVKRIRKTVVEVPVQAPVPEVNSLDVKVDRLGLLMELVGPMEKEIEVLQKEVKELMGTVSPDQKNIHVASTFHASLSAQQDQRVVDNFLAFDAMGQDDYIKFSTMPIGKLEALLSKEAVNGVITVKKNSGPRCLKVARRI